MVSISNDFLKNSIPDPTQQTPNQLKEFYIGLILAIVSSVFIGTSFIFKKKGLLRLNGKSTRAGDGGYGYLRDYIWWTGMIMMTAGELSNFAAYTMAPASMVTPLGALSVLVTALLSPRCLGEKINLPGKLGCVLCIAGSTMIVIHAPKEQAITSTQMLLLKMTDFVFLSYAGSVVVCALLAVLYLGPRYGHSNPMVYIFITASIGSLTVMNCKALGVVMKERFAAVPPGSSSTTPLLIGLSVAVLVCLLIQVNFLNRALDVFNINLVTPLLYVTFSVFVILASAILFREWRNQSLEDMLGNLAGLTTIISGIFLLHAFKDLHISLATLNIRVRRDTDNYAVANGAGVAKLPT